MTRTLPHIAAVAAVCLGSSQSYADEWPRFRGPNGDGQAEALDIPSEFTDADYAWRMPLPGLGHS